MHVSNASAINGGSNKVHRKQTDGDSFLKRQQGRNCRGNMRGFISYIEHQAKINLITADSGSLANIRFAVVMFAYLKPEISILKPTKSDMW
ncbi:Carnitine O-palmitoyltransferase 2 [Dirofilaria immitis]